MMQIIVVVLQDDADCCGGVPRMTPIVVVVFQHDADFCGGVAG